MKLYCVRHGETCTPEIDVRCPLTERGIAQVERIARHMAEFGVQIAQVLHSDKLRAQQTADIIVRALSVVTVKECSTLQPQNEVQDLLELVSSLTEDTALVGHLPLLSELVNMLVMKAPSFYPLIHFPPATIVCLELQENYHWIIRWVLNPEIM